MAESFTHQVLPYADTAEFTATTARFVRSGLAAGDAVLAVSGGRNRRLLREALGGAAGRVDFVDAAGWYTHPARTLAGCLTRVDELARAGRRLRLVAEPAWTGRSQREIAEWQRIEAVVNVAFAGTGTAILCPYNARTLPEPIMVGAHRTHPETVHGANPRYMDPWEYTALADRSPLPPVPADAEHLPLTYPDLHWLRVYVGAAAERAGVRPEERHRLLLAVTEVVTNAVRHGTAPAGLWLWTEPGELVCQVTDAGHWRPPDGWGLVPPGPGRFGLWVVRLLCSLVQIRTGPRGTTVRFRVDTRCEPETPGQIGPDGVI